MTTNTDEDYEAHLAWLAFTEAPISRMEIPAYQLAEEN